MVDGDLTGFIATSRAGRDKGRSFIITGHADDCHVYLVDGILRKLVRPKRKKHKHLKLHDVCAENIKEKLLSGKQVFDAEIRNCLQSYGFNLKEDGEGENHV